MTRRQPIFAVLTLLLLPCVGLGGRRPGIPIRQPRPPPAQAFGDIQARTSGDPVLLTQPERYSQWDARFGWWAMWNQGSPQRPASTRT